MPTLTKEDLCLQVGCFNGHSHAVTKSQKKFNRNTIVANHFNASAKRSVSCLCVTVCTLVNKITFGLNIKHGDSTLPYLGQGCQQQLYTVSPKRY